MACEFPGAHTPEELWQNVLAGRRFFRKAPLERMPPEYFDSNPEAPGKSYCDQMAVINGWRFDPVEFGIPPVTFHATDIAHWLALDTAQRALRGTGLDLEAVNRARIGVVVGNSLTGEFSRSHNLRFRWPYVERSLRRVLAREGMAEPHVQQLLTAVRQSYEAPLPEITEDTLAGNMANTIAGRICNYFDLGAGGFTVDGACSSSLLSVAAACNALANGEMDFALAGGVDVSLDPFEIVGFAKTRALAADDIRPYDQRADGMLTGEGCGIVVLARAKEARAAGYPIRALIRGWGISSDGAGGLTAPGVEGQVRALHQTYQRAGYPLATVELIEGHGTGTSLGDKVELTALRRVLDESGGRGVCRIGSIKANIGHCKAAAGIAGLIKTVMALERKIIPPTLNCDVPNVAFGLPLGRFRPSTEGLAWPKPATPRRASVSAMGFGGANAHLALEEFNRRAKPSSKDLSLLGSPQRSELIVLAADDLEELRRVIEKLLPATQRLCRAELTDLSAALSKQPLRAKLRLAIVAESPWGLDHTLKGCAERLARHADISALDDPANGVFAGAALNNPKAVALFPGQGSQRLNMGECWPRRFPLIRDLYREVAQLREATPICSSLEGHIFKDRLAADEATLAAWDKELQETRVAQPAIVLSSLATLQVLQFFGLQPHFAIGHSLGEISALAAGGVWDALTAVRVAALRGEAMSTLAAAGSGGMVALSATPEEARELLGSLDSSLVISNYNSPRQTVISGPAPAIRQLLGACKQRGVACRPLAVSHAFHSGMVAPAADAFGDALRKLAAAAGQVGEFHTETAASAIAGRHKVSRPSTHSGKANCEYDSRATATVISSVTGQVLPIESDLARHLADQIRRPVRFMDAVQQAAAAGPALWLEVGPGAVLTGFVRTILSLSDVPCLATDLPGGDGFDLLNRVLARAWVLGFLVRLDRLFAHRFYRPLDAEHYEPQFIVNPCERPVPASAPVAEPAPAAQEPAAAGLEPAAPEDRESLLAFALDWIAKRTGFPRATITAEKRLRDDLNLDSIKAGELIILLAQKLNRRLETDPAVIANARIADAVEAVLAQSRQPGAGAAAGPAAAPELEPAPGLEEWIRSFQMDFVPAPRTDAGALPLSDDAACVIVAEAASPRAACIADRLRGEGLNPLVTDWESLLKNGDAPPNLALLVFLLPENEKSFLACSPEEFDQRVEGTAAMLFRVFRWAGHGRDGAELRGLVLRAVTGGPEQGADLDAGSGFLKSLALEYPAANFKWLALPAAWSPERWAQVAVQELRSPKDRVAYAYTVEGQRMAESALLCVPAAVGSTTSRPLPPGPEALGPDDVVLVSGGAKGVTCELALALARQTKARLALLGSSPRPDASANPQDSEILRNLRRFEECGVRHLYMQADVTDLAAVQRAVRESELALGPVTALLHGAGVTHLRLFREKELEEFLQCVRIKARGLYNLLVAVQPSRLKAVHVVSSVLGKTGMHGQADYALANAWLDGAVRALKAVHPAIHCLSLGYTAWAETGLAQRVGVLDSLRSIGVTPISVEQGVAAYLNRLGPAQPDGVFVVTGRLTREFESRLYEQPARPRGRYLEQVRHWVPGVELVADALLSHQTDLYLPEHVFEGTPVFPGVMAIEALVEVAMACAGQAEWPVLRAVQFNAPLIVPENSQVIVRTLALADAPCDGRLRVRVAICSSQDGFKQNYFEAECWFESQSKVSVLPPNLALPRPMPEPLALDPETLCPIPLFQGKFFRRIQAIRCKTMGRQSLTDIQVPAGEQYFQSVPEEAPITPSPAVRDACWQSGALILPPGCLPRRLEELRFHRRATPSETVNCHARVWSQSAAGYLVDLAAFSGDGELLETTKGLRLEQTGRGVAGKPPPAPLKLGRVSSDLQALLPQTPHAIVLVPQEEMEQTPRPAELAEVDMEQVQSQVPLPRRVSALANLVATRRAALAYAHQAKGSHAAPVPGSISLAQRPDGKPELLLADDPPGGFFQDSDVSLADGGGLSLAWLAPPPVGADLEQVEARNAEIWRGLLGNDGYALALRVMAQTGEQFDCAATRVWTLLEAGKKAAGLQRVVPEFESPRGGPWLSFVGIIQGAPTEFLSATLALPSGTAALTVAVRRAAVEPGCTAESSAPGLIRSFDTLLADFRRDMERLRGACAGDPQEPGLAARHAQFLSVIEATRRRLEFQEHTTPAADVPALQRRFQQTLLPFLEGSQNFRHTLVKPFGYAGDFRLLEMLAANRCSSHGLAYHFDQSQLEYPASVACRQRIEWIGEELLARLKALPRQPALPAPTEDGDTPLLVILDLGVGAAPVEQHFLRRGLEAPLCLHAVDMEPAALEYVSQNVAGPHLGVHPWRLDLRDPASLSRIGELATRADVVIALGLMEALTDHEAVPLLQTVLRSLPDGGVLYTENFVPTHPTRSIMEWFLDFHLSYRSLEELRSVAVRAGADTSRIELKLDTTGSLALLKLQR
jgi:enediyne polyketide synthase